MTKPPLLSQTGVMKWKAPDPNTVFAFLAGVAFATLFHQRGTVFFEGVTIGIILVVVGFSFALLQHPNESIDTQGVKSVSLSQAVFHEGTVDAASISALIHATKILQNNTKEGESNNHKKSTDLLGNDLPSGFFDGEAVLGKTTLDEAEIAFQKFRDRAKERSRVLKAMSTWVKDFAEIQRNHGKALDKLAVLATTSIVNKLAEAERDLDDGQSVSSVNSTPTTEGPKLPSKNAHLPPTSSARADEPRYFTEDRHTLPGPSPLQHWWRSLAGHTRHRSKESLALSTITYGSGNDLAAALAQLQAEQNLLEKRCSAQGTILCKELRDAMIAKMAADREHARAEDRLRTHVEHATLQGPNDKHGAMSRTHSSPNLDKDWIRLSKAASEAEAKRTEVSKMVTVVRDRFEAKMPVILHDFALIDHNLQVQCQAALLRFATSARDIMIPTLKSHLLLEEDLGANPFAVSLQNVLNSHQVDLPHMSAILPALRQSKWIPVHDAAPATFQHQHHHKGHHAPSYPLDNPLSITATASHKLESSGDSQPQQQQQSNSRSNSVSRSDSAKRVEREKEKKQNEEAKDLHTSQEKKPASDSTKPTKDPAAILRGLFPKKEKQIENKVGSEWDDGDLKPLKQKKKNHSVSTEGDDDGDDEGMDMRSFAAAALAATLPSTLPPIPLESVSNVGEETCVWLNAFLGRIYRDAARSPHFHLWFAARIQDSLNKGWANRPDFVDEMKVTVNGFGPTPPLLTAARWLPTSAMENSDLEYDLAMNAKFRFRGALSFTVETKFWINWPRERCASIPLQVHIRMTEMAGAVRMGVRRNKSFVSFLAEPFSIFEVDSTIGKHETKFKQLRRLDAIIVGRIKSVIARKLVWPNCKHFRLLWPKSWWPPEAPPAAPASTSTASFSSATSPQQSAPGSDTQSPPQSPVITAAAGGDALTPIVTPSNNNPSTEKKGKRNRKSDRKNKISLDSAAAGISPGDLAVTPKERRRAERAAKKANKALFKSFKSQSAAESFHEGTPRTPPSGAAGVLRGRIGLVRLWRRIKSPHNRSFSQLDTEDHDDDDDDIVDTQTSVSPNSFMQPSAHAPSKRPSTLVIHTGADIGIQHVNMAKFDTLLHDIINDLSAERRFQGESFGGLEGGGGSASKVKRRITTDNGQKVANKWVGLHTTTGADSSKKFWTDNKVHFPDSLRGEEENDDNVVAAAAADDDDDDDGTTLRPSYLARATTDHSATPQRPFLDRYGDSDMIQNSAFPAVIMTADHAEAARLKRRHSLHDFRTHSLFLLLSEGQDDDDDDDSSTSSEEEEDEYEEAEDEDTIVADEEDGVDLFFDDSSDEEGHSPNHKEDTNILINEKPAKKTWGSRLRGLRQKTNYLLERRKARAAERRQRANSHSDCEDDDDDEYRSGEDEEVSGQLRNDLKKTRSAVEELELQDGSESDNSDLDTIVTTATDPMLSTSLRSANNSPSISPPRSRSVSPVPVRNLFVPNTKIDITHDDGNEVGDKVKQQQRESFISKAAAKARMIRAKSRELSPKRPSSRPIRTSSASKNHGSIKQSHIEQSVEERNRAKKSEGVDASSIFGGQYDMKEVPLALQNVASGRILFADEDHCWGVGFGAAKSEVSQLDSIGTKLPKNQLWWFLEQKASNLKLPPGLEENSGVYRLSNADNGRKLYAHEHSPNKRTVSKDIYIWEREIGAGPKTASYKDNSWVVHKPSPHLLRHMLNQASPRSNQTSSSSSSSSSSSFSSNFDHEAFPDFENLDSFSECYVTLVNFESGRTLYAKPIPEGGLKSYHKRTPTNAEKKEAIKIAKNNGPTSQEAKFSSQSIDYSYGLGAIPNERLLSGGGSEHLLKYTLWRLLVPASKDYTIEDRPTSSPSRGTKETLQTLAFSKAFDVDSEDDSEDDEEEENSADESNEDSAVSDEEEHTKKSSNKETKFSI